MEAMESKPKQLVWLSLSVLLVNDDCCELGLLAMVSKWGMLEELIDYNLKTAMGISLIINKTKR